MCFFVSLMPATVLVSLGYFILLTLPGGEDALRTFGQLLAVWAFLFALFFPMCGAYVTLSAKCPIQEMMKAKMPTA